MNRRDWWAIGYGVTESNTTEQLSVGCFQVLALKNNTAVNREGADTSL